MVMADAMSKTPNLPACLEQVSGRMCSCVALCSTLLAQSAHHYPETGAQLDGVVSTPACPVGQPTHRGGLAGIQGDRDVLGQGCHILVKQGSKLRHAPLLPTSTNEVRRHPCGTF